MTMSFTPDIDTYYGAAAEPVPPRLVPQNLDEERDPFTLALDHCASIMHWDPMALSTDSEQEKGLNSHFFVRNDSYTDWNTGVTHVYIRQVYDGSEVFNADMNVNVKDGKVLSYGNSVSPHL